MVMTEQVATTRQRMARGKAYRRKHHVRALCQTVAFVCVVAGFCLYNGVSHYFLLGEKSSDAAEAQFSLETTGENMMVSDIRNLHDLTNVPKEALMETFAPTDGSFTSNVTSANNLTETEECPDINKADPAWMLVFHFLGVLYMFLALAIVCDEFFVPALEEMSSGRRMNLSMDVAGATLMAAGGSAPELFTSLFGTFAESEVGFGTIVGSAVFNILFVIAMCALMSREVLTLTWWPLFRDSFCYAVGLAVLSIFVGVTSKNVIETWEAVVLFILYLGYIAIMWQNANLYKFFTGKELEYEDEVEDGPEENGADPESPQMVKALSAREINANLGRSDSVRHFRWQGTFRAGILKLLRDPESWVETAGVGIVAKIAGDADYVFKQIDTDGNGVIDRDELKRLFEVLDCHLSPNELDQVFKELDDNGDGEVHSTGMGMGWTFVL